MDERRKHPRVAIQLEVNYQNLDTFYRNPVLDISQEGMFIETESPLPLGTEIDLEFTLPGQETRIRAKGLVVWKHERTPLKISSHAPGMGIRLKSVLPKDLALIRACIEQVLAEQKEDK